MLSRIELLHQVENVLSVYCKECLVKAALRKEKGKLAAHKFCITECTVGEKLKQYGNKMS